MAVTHLETPLGFAVACRFRVSPHDGTRTLNQTAEDLVVQHWLARAAAGGIAATLLAASIGCGPTAGVDLVVVGGVVHTSDPDFPVARAFAVSAGRFVELGVIASMNPHHCITGIDKYNTARLGDDRVALSFAWNGLRRSGATLVFGSDWATAPLDPLQQLYAAVLREKPGGGPEGGWYPEHRLSFEEALFAYTQAPADAAGWGDQIGSISVGKRADFVVLDDFLSLPLDRGILQRSVQATYLNGMPVFTRN